MLKQTIYCCACQKDTGAHLTNGAEIYPHRPDLHTLNMWKCPDCGNYVGCHKKNGGITPLGTIPTPQLRSARKNLHRIIDPLWKLSTWSRRQVYNRLTEKLGFEFHAAQINTMADIDRAVKAAKEIRDEIQEQRLS